MLLKMQWYGRSLFSIILGFWLKYLLFQQKHDIYPLTIHEDSCISQLLYIIYISISISSLCIILMLMFNGVMFHIAGKNSHKIMTYLKTDSRDKTYVFILKDIIIPICLWFPLVIGDFLYFVYWSCTTCLYL